MTRPGTFFTKTMHLPTPLLLFLASLCMLPAAMAAQLGPARGEPLIGHELRLSIPVEGLSQPLTRECISLGTHSSDQAGQFLPPKLKLEVMHENGSVTLLVTGNSIREPVVAFTLSVACGIEVVREYQLLADMPASPSPQVPVTSITTASAAAPPRTKIAAKTTSTQAQNLLLMSRQRYPGSPRTRERFIRIMLDANPSLSSRHTPLDATTSLVFPDELPPLPAAAAVPKPKPAQPITPSTPATALASPGNRTQPAKTPQNDRLLIGQAPAGIDAQIMDELVQIIPLMKEQNQSQLALMSRLARIEAEFLQLQQQQTASELRQRVLEQRLVTLETERLAEKNPAPSTAFGFLELVAAILVGGILGGLSLLTLQRWRNSHGFLLANATAQLFPEAMPQNPTPAPSSAAAAVVTATPPSRTAIEQIPTSGSEEDHPHLRFFNFPLDSLPSSTQAQTAESDEAFDFRRTK